MMLRWSSARAESMSVEPEKSPSADEEYVSEQLKLMGVSLAQDADRDAHEDSESDAEDESSDGEEGEGRGLGAFEDVLSSWLTAAHSKTSQAHMKAQASLPLRPKAAGGGGQSTLARIQEQQQQLIKEEADLETVKSSVDKKSSDKSRENAQVKDAVETAKPSAPVGTESAEPAEPAEEEDEEPDSPTGAAGWKDVLSNWMTAAGVTAPAQQTMSNSKAARVSKSPGQQAASHLKAGLGGKASGQQSAESKAAETPSWLADVSSDEDEGDRAGEEVTPPRTSSISEPKLKQAASHELSGEAHRQSSDSKSPQRSQHAQHGASLDTAQPQHAQHDVSLNATAAPLLPPNPQQGYSMPIHSLLASSGISSQDVRLDADLLGRARSDPPVLWGSSAPGFTPRLGQEPQLPPAVATSMSAQVYPADQGLPPQVCSVVLHSLLLLFLCQAAHWPFTQ